jgi:hypothetical protein
LGSKRSGNHTGDRYKGGRPITKATIQYGNPIRVALKSTAGYEHIGTGVTTIERSGTDRIVRVVLEDGSTIIITVY